MRVPSKRQNLPLQIIAVLFGLSVNIHVTLAQDLPEAKGACPVTLVAQGVRGTQGTVGFVIYASKAGWPDKYEEAVARNATPATAGDVSVVVNIIPGRYAVVVLHDENGNKRLDKKPSGRPREGYGLSNNPKAVLKTPSFAAAAVNVACESTTLIKIHYPSHSEDKENR